MISPMTPPGTEVVCIVNYEKVENFPGLIKGNIYTVELIDLESFTQEVAVVLEEITEHNPMGDRYCCKLEWFRPLDLGKLDEFLNIKEKEPV